MSKDNKTYGKSPAADIAERIEEIEKAIDILNAAAEMQRWAIKETATAAMAAIKRNPGREILENVVKRVS